jgi:hypothetical protein
MTSRLDDQMTIARRVVRELQRLHVAVHRVTLDVQSPRPVIETGTGPFDWVCEDFGHDAGGPYWNYSARFQGIELRRQVREGRSGRSGHVR